MKRQFQYEIPLCNNLWHTKPKEMCESMKMCERDEIRVKPFTFALNFEKAPFLQLCVDFTASTRKIYLETTKIALFPQTTISYFKYSQTVMYIMYS